MNFDYPAYLCGDINNEQLYRVIQSSPDELIEALVERFATQNTPEGCLAVRQRFNEEKDDLELVERAAHFMFINQHAYNGLTRYNLSGGINTSYGKYKAPYLPAKEIKACHAVAPRCEFAHQSFQSSIDCAGPSDVIFCDPPYEPLEGKKASRLMPLVDLVLKISRP